MVPSMATIDYNVMTEEHNHLLFKKGQASLEKRKRMLKTRAQQYDCLL